MPQGGLDADGANQVYDLVGAAPEEVHAQAFKLRRADPENNHQETMAVQAGHGEALTSHEGNWAGRLA